ncbi:hypothetical protein FRC12_002040 [Ceratobasidium sp. 428]|nr:hypothetical protein FRC12_002040 [Ceratobasidium sp. 428]
MVYRPGAKTLLFADASTIEAFSNFSENTQAMLSSLEQAQLDGVRFDWGSPVYHDLVDLKLVFFCHPTSMCILELASILLASPRLSTLKMDSLTITDSRGWARPPIVLSQLQALSLTHIDPASLQHLLPLVTLPVSSVKVAIGPTNFTAIRLELEQLIRRSRVAELCCWQDNCDLVLPTWLAIFRIFPRLQNLVLHHFHMNKAPVSTPVSRSSELPLPLQTVNITFSQCGIRLESLKVFAASEDVHTVRLLECDVLSKRGRIQYDTPIPKLFERCPSLKFKCTTADNRLNKHWDYFGTTFHREY